MDPFHKTVMMRLTVISIVNPQKFVFFFFGVVDTILLRSGADAWLPALSGSLTNQ